MTTDAHDRAAPTAATAPTAPTASTASTASTAQAGDTASLKPPQRAPIPPRPERRFAGLPLRTWRWIACAAWAIAFVTGLIVNGLPFDRAVLIFWIMAGLIAGSIGRRPLWTVLVDWLPFAAVLILYDLSRGAAETLGRPTAWTPQIRIDRWFGAGNDPTVWLQAHLRQPEPPWWEVIVSCTYVSFFILPYAVAGVLWLRQRQAWRQFAVRFLTITFAGLVGFVVYPAAPPWAAAQCTPSDVAGGPADPSCLSDSPRTDGGLLGPVRSHHEAGDHLVGGGGGGVGRLGLHGARGFFDEGQASVNLVAAIPSLHAGITLLTCLFLWPRVRWGWRPLLVAYPLLMVFSLVYSGEHYLIDCLIGFALAVVVHLGIGAIERWWTTRRQRRLSLVDPHPTGASNSHAS